MRLIEQQDITSTEPALPYSHRFNFEYYKKTFGVLPMSHRISGVSHLRKPMVCRGAHGGIDRVIGGEKKQREKEA